jgi:hypothetical protein
MKVMETSLARKVMIILMGGTTIMNLNRKMLIFRVVRVI